ncbi:hypothetical protein NF27_DN00120 [Candidatus Jidaibacter acanthamoeba]|uniref:Uncharacterized protein n=1 Tax=Candidatus Jidaibacter acanthamoebae TaxID=86105 RepID=A0A0C1N051_9RICK|nr:hypothetical protein [Candidatus Jidaibacter acanthamoeba]KIE05696.1 hypothetical protein NF27_DN00120 [Candidatus Jidaibacter acanthamoeba]
MSSVFARSLTLGLIGDDTLSISYDDPLVEEIFQILESIQEPNLKTFITKIEQDGKLKDLARQYQLKVKLRDLDEDQQKEYFKTIFYNLSKVKDINQLENFFNDLKK